VGINVPSAAGDGPNSSVQILAAELTRQLNQQFVVDNRHGAPAHSRVVQINTAVIPVA
jgi:hypothetical protein